MKKQTNKEQTNCVDWHNFSVQRFSFRRRVCSEQAEWKSGRRGRELLESASEGPLSNRQRFRPDSLPGRRLRTIPRMRQALQ